MKGLRLQAAIGMALTREGALGSMLQTCVEAIVQHLDVAFARVWTLHASEPVLELQASAGLYTRIDGSHRRVPVGAHKIGRIAEERKPHLTNDVLSDPLVGDSEWARREGMVAFAGYPLLVDGQLVGVVALFSRSALPDDTLTALAAVSDALALGIRRKTTEAERERLIAALGRSNRELDQFASVASHDLKAPLRGIATLARFIEEDLGDRLTAAGHEQLRLLSARVTRMEALVDGILDYSRAGRGSEPEEEFELGQLVSDVVELVAPRWEATIAIAPDLPTLHDSRAPVEHVFLNLIDNALQHSGKRDVCVRIGWGDLGDSYEFTVADDGVGVPEAAQDRVWGIFQRLDSSTNGTGIGLAIVKKIVLARGGRVWISRTEGGGATFHLAWPK